MDLPYDVVNFPISFEEALNRLTLAESVEVRFEQRPNTGRTFQYFFPRPDIVQMLRDAPVIAEGGVSAQATGFGIYVPFVHRVHGEGVLFYATRVQVLPEVILGKEALRVYEH